MGNGGKDRTENRWDVSDVGQSAPLKAYYICIFPREAHYEVSGVPSQQRQICTWRHCRVLFCKWDQHVESLYTFTFNPGQSVSIATTLYRVQFNSTPSSVTVCWDLMPCLPNYTASHHKTNLNTDHLAKLHTNTFDLTPAPTKSRNSIRIFSSMRVKFNKQYCG